MIYSQNFSGTRTMAGNSIFLLGLLITEAKHPGYSISDNYISDFGVGSTV
jgi:hypothetical membrane protein